MRRLRGSLAPPGGAGSGAAGRVRNMVSLLEFLTRQKLQNIEYGVNILGDVYKHMINQAF